MRKGEGWKGRGGEGGGGSMLNVYTDISAFWRASVTIYRILASVQWVEIRLHVCVCVCFCIMLFVFVFEWLHIQLFRKHTCMCVGLCCAHVECFSIETYSIWVWVSMWEYYEILESEACEGITSILSENDGGRVSASVPLHSNYCPALIRLHPANWESSS